MLFVSDVHGAFADLRRVASMGEMLLVLGDLINLTDYRTGEGITADILGLGFAKEAATARARGDYEGMRSLFASAVGDDTEAFRAAFSERVVAQYRETRAALDGAVGFVTYGNVDRPTCSRNIFRQG